jgi:hypothetical protein
MILSKNRYCNFTIKINVFQTGALAAEAPPDVSWMDLKLRSRQHSIFPQENKKEARVHVHLRPLI